MSFRFIGVTAINQTLDLLHHGIDIFCGQGLHGGRQRIQLRHIFVVCIGIALAELGDGLVVLFRCLVNFVVHVGDVARVLNAGEASLQQSKQHIKHHHRTGIANMHVVVHSGATDVHGHLVRVDGGEHLFLLSQGVV